MPRSSPIVADLMIITLGLLGGLASYLANPCGPREWAVVKAARHVDATIPTSSRGADRVSEPVPRHALDGGLAGAHA